jgi:rhodanese-related sulfurtransferase
MRRELAAVLAALSLTACASSRWAQAAAESRGRVVRPAVAYEMLRDNPDLVVLDVRTFDEYQAPAGHLERAISAPLADLPLLWTALDLRDEDTILLYGGADGAEQLEATRLLIRRGLRFVVQIDGGLESWISHGFAVVVEDAPLSPMRRLGGAAQSAAGD